MPNLGQDDMVFKKRIAERIAELRTKTGLRPSVFAKENQKDRQTQHRIEKGRGVTIYTIRKFCKSINMPLSEFFNSPLFSDPDPETPNP